MGMNKDKSTAVTEAPLTNNVNAAPASGTDAAVGRLTAPKVEAAPTPAAKNVYKQRDFDEEARGKTRCVQFEAALMSPAIAGMKFKNMTEYLALVREAAEAGLAYTFGEDKK